MTVLFGALGGIVAVGMLVIVSAWTPGRPVPGAAAGGVDVRRWLAPGTVAIVAGAVALAATGWIVGGIAAGWLTVLGARAWERRGSHRRGEQARIEALAAWCEQLRDLLSADHGIVGTIDATIRTCPEPIRPAVAGLARRLTRQSTDSAVARFADELDDPDGDLVASVIALAMSRSARTSEMLSELAATTRERAAMRRRVDAERAGARSEARFVVGFTAVVVVGVVIFGQGSEFLEAYDTAAGQLFLAVVAGFFGLGGWWLVRLTRFQRPARFLATTVNNEDGVAA